MKLRTEQRLVEASLELEADPDLPRRYCIDCEEEFPLTEKYFDRSGKGNGLREVCKSCVDERNTMVRRLRRSGASEKSVQSYVCRRVFSANARKRERRKAAELSKIADLVSTDETVELVKCRRCQESFPLERRYWRISKSGYRMPDCCYCEEEKAAERRLAKWIEPSSFDESFDSFLDALD